MDLSNVFWIRRIVWLLGRLLLRDKFHPYRCKMSLRGKKTNRPLSNLENRLPPGNSAEDKNRFAREMLSESVKAISKKTITVHGECNDRQFLSQRLRRMTREKMMILLVLFLVPPVQSFFFLIQLI